MTGMKIKGMTIMIHSTDTQETYEARGNLMTKSTKEQIRDIIEEYDIPDEDVNMYAREFIVDNHLTAPFLVYLKQVLAGEI